MSFMSFFRFALSKVLLIVLATLFYLFVTEYANCQVGQPLSSWTEGFLEIHHINTGQGDVAFIIMPDGTTMIIDAGDISSAERPPLFKAPPKPDTTRSAGEWMGRYIGARHPHSVDPKIDYALMTHFHSDHIAGLKDLIKVIPVKNIFDRDWPEYKSLSNNSQEYFEVSAKSDELGIKMGRFKAGRKDQFVLLNNPDKYPRFHIRNLAANGEIWIGRGTQVRSRFSKRETINENMKSTALVLRYGNFSYFTGGDLYEPMEMALAWLIGPADVHVSNHHGSEAHPFFLEILRPRIHIVQVWDSIQPRPQVFERFLDPSVYSGPRDIFLTNGMWEGRRENIADWFDENTAQRYAEEFMPAVTAEQGHIVIRVDPSGDRYQIYMLDDRDETFTVKSVHGPYESNN